MATGKGPYFEAFLRKHQYQNQSSASPPTLAGYPSSSSSSSSSNGKYVPTSSSNATASNSTRTAVLPSASASLTVPQPPIHPPSLSSIVPDRDRFITDRNAYIHYLETQIERACQACLTVENCDQRIQQQDTYLQNLTEQLQRLHETTRVTRSITDKQGTEIGNSIANIHVNIQEMNGKQEAYVLTLASLQANYSALQLFTQNLVNEYRTNYQDLTNKYTTVQQELIESRNQHEQLRQTFESMQIETTNKFTDLFEGMQTKFDQLQQLVQSAQQSAFESAESARQIHIQAQKTADTAVMAEASAISAKEEASAANTSAKFAVEELRTTTLHAVNAADKAAFAEIQAKAAFQAVIASTGGKIPKNEMVPLITKTLEPIPRLLSERTISGTTLTSTMIETAISDVLQVTSQEFRQLHNRIDGIEQEIQRTNESFKDYQQSNRQYVIGALDDHTQRIEIGLQSMQNETNRLIENVKLHTTTITAATAEDLEKRIEQVATCSIQAENTLRKEQTENAQTYRQQYDSLLTLLAKYDLKLNEQEQQIMNIHTFSDNLQAKLNITVNDLATALGKIISVGTDGTAMVQETLPAWSKDIDTVKTSFVNQFTRITNSIASADTERKQLLRFADELIQKYTDNHGLIQQLQGHLRTLALQVETLNESMANSSSSSTMAISGTATGNNVPDKKGDDTKEGGSITVPPVPSDAPTATANTSQYQLTPSELLRLVDSAIQPRILEFFNEREEQINDKITRINQTMEQANALLVTVQDAQIHLDQEQGQIPLIQNHIATIVDTIETLKVQINKDHVEHLSTINITNKRMDSIEIQNKELFESTQTICTDLHGTSERLVQEMDTKVRSMEALYATLTTGTNNNVSNAFSRYSTVTVDDNRTVQNTTSSTVPRSVAPSTATLDAILRASSPSPRFSRDSLPSVTIPAASSFNPSSLPFTRQDNGITQVNEHLTLLTDEVHSIQQAMYTILRQQNPSSSATTTTTTLSSSSSSPSRSLFVPRTHPFIPSVVPAPLSSSVIRDVSNISRDIALQNSPSVPTVTNLSASSQQPVIGTVVSEPPGVTNDTVPVPPSLDDENSSTVSELNMSINSRRRLQGLVLRPLNSRNFNNNDHNNTMTTTNEHDISTIPTVPNESLPIEPEAIEPEHTIHTTLYQTTAVLSSVNNGEGNDNVPSSSESSLIVEISPIITSTKIVPSVIIDNRGNEALPVIPTSTTGNRTILPHSNEHIDTIAIIPTMNDNIPRETDGITSNYRSELLIPTVNTGTVDPVPTVEVHALHVEIPLDSHIASSSPSSYTKLPDDNKDEPVAPSIGTVVPTIPATETEEKDTDNASIITTTTTTNDNKIPTGRNRSNSRSSIRSTGSSSSLKDIIGTTLPKHEFGRLPSWYNKRNEEIKQQQQQQNNDEIINSSTVSAKLNRPPSRESVHSTLSKGTSSRRISTSSSASTASKNSSVRNN